MKRCVLALAVLLLIAAGLAEAQTIITIGSGTSTQRQPMGMYWGHERSAALYKASEISFAGNITALGWDIQTLTSATDGPVKIYLATTADTALTAVTWATMISSATLLYDATPTFAAGGWQTFTLSGSFAYGGSDNLLVLVETNFGGIGGESSTAKAIRYTTTAGGHEIWFADNSPPTGNGSLNSNRPNIQLTFSATAAIDVGAQTLVSPGIGGCYGTNQTVTIRIKNYGTAAVNFATNPVTVSSSAAGPNPVTFPPVVINSGSLASGGTQDVNVSTTYNMTAGGTYTFNASTAMAADTVLLNNAMPAAQRTVLGTALLPQIVDFTGFTGANLTTLFPDWKEQAGVNPAGTTSLWTSATGLSGAGNVSARINLYTTTRNEWIVGPKFLATASSELSFNAAVSNWNSVTVGDTMGSDDRVQVMISTDCGSTWTSILQMDSTTNLGLAYTPFSVPLAAYAGQQVILAFYATDGPVDDARDYDFHIDDIEITNNVAKDIQVVRVDLSAGPFFAGAPITVSAVIRNNGTEPNPASVPVTYKLGSSPASQGDGVGQVFSPSWTGDLDTVTFTTTYTPGAPGTFTVYVKAFYAGDLVAGNDQATKDFRVYPPGILFEDWTSESALSRWKVINNDGGTNEWYRTTLKSLSGPASVGSDYESTTLRNDDWLITPKLTVAAGDSITFWHSIQSATYPESLEVWVSTTGRTIPDFTTKLGGFVDNTITWKYRAYSLGAFAGQNIYVAFVNKGLDEFTIYLDDIGGPQLYVPAVDLATVGFFQSTGLPTPEPAMAPVQMPAAKGDAKPVAKLSATAGNAPAPAPGVTGTGQFRLMTAAPVGVKAAIKNQGSNAASYSLAWSVGGTAQTPYGGPSVPSGSTDTASLSYAASATGTFITTGKITVASDEDPDNDSSAFRMRVYPDTYVRQINDRGDNAVDTWVGWGNATTAMKAGVKFTAAVTMQLAGVDMIYRTETVPSGIISVQVRAAGATAPGAVLYTKGYDAADYFTGAGDYVFLPFDGSAPTIPAGTEYWITVKFPVGILYPGGVHSTGFTAGRSFYEGSPDTTLWSALIITTERAWMLRSVGVPAGVVSTVDAGWNLVSNPVATAADSMRQLFPSSLFPYGFAFSGSSGYQPRYRLTNGEGYWGKFPAVAPVIFLGSTIALDTIPVQAGWNIVGSISASVDTGTITSIPPGLRTSTSWFGYDSGYVSAPSIEPGKAYWVKAGSAGSFIFSGSPAPARAASLVPDPAAGLNTITIRDAAGRVQTLTFGAGAQTRTDELPPPPPEGAFDARFETAEGGALLRVHAAGEVLPVVLRSAAAPVTVSWTIRSGGYTLDAGQGLRAMAGEGSVTLPAGQSRFTVRATNDGALPAEFALLQNYPNPFNPSTTLRFALPVDSRVTLEVFNALGQRVAVPVSADLPAGYHAADWGGAATGVYFARFSASGTDGRTFSSTQKLLLLK